MVTEEKQKWLLLDSVFTAFIWNRVTLASSNNEIKQSYFGSQRFISSTKTSQLNKIPTLQN